MRHNSLGPFLRKLAQKRQTDQQQQQAHKAIEIFHELGTAPEMLKPGSKTPSEQSNTIAAAKDGVHGKNNSTSPMGSSKIEQANGSRIAASESGYRRRSPRFGSTEPPARRFLSSAHVVGAVS